MIRFGSIKELGAPFAFRDFEYNRTYCSTVFKLLDRAGGELDGLQQDEKDLLDKHFPKSLYQRKLTSVKVAVDRYTLLTLASLGVANTAQQWIGLILDRDFEVSNSFPQRNLNDYNNSLQGTVNDLKPEDIQTLCDRLDNCRFFSSEDDIVGIGPSAMKEDDILCVLKGSFSPCVLRPSSNGNWHLISGECATMGWKPQYPFLKRMFGIRMHAYVQTWVQDWNDLEIEFGPWETIEIS